MSKADRLFVAGDELLRLQQEAAIDPRLRARICLHDSTMDPLQQMIIGLCRTTYIPPHRHMVRDESLQVMSGVVRVIFFDGDGKVTRAAELGGEGKQMLPLCRVPKGMWHMLTVCTEFAVVHETAPGPFLRDSNEFPEWAPPSDGIAAFLRRVDAEVSALGLAAT